MIYTINWVKSSINPLPNPKTVIRFMGFTAMEMEQETYSYPISNFKFGENFNYNWKEMNGGISLFSDTQYGTVPYSDLRLSRNIGSKA